MLHGPSRGAVALKSTPLLVLALAIAPLSFAHASLGNPQRQAEAPLPAAAQATDASAGDVPVVAPAPASTTPRRSRMVEAGADDPPVMRFSAMYRVVGRDEAGKDNCLKGTGTRLRQNSGGTGGCAIGNGRVWVPGR